MLLNVIYARLQMKQNHVIWNTFIVNLFLEFVRVCLCWGCSSMVEHATCNREIRVRFPSSPHRFVGLRV